MADEKKKKSGLNLKVILIGIPLFAIQVVAVYYITANVLLSRFEEQANAKNVKNTQSNHGSEGNSQHYEEFTDSHDGDSYEDEPYEDDQQGAPKVLGEHIYSIDDIIVNPSGTDGKRLLLTSVGLDVATEEQYQTLEKKEILVKDIIISVLASKRMEELKDYSKKDSLKIEISKNIRRSIRNVRINKVYFSKYIIQ
ncbi:MAG: hypothetical protein SCALA702_26820 [Melioribacteraceae bacterium]|nr:MAG: hypothetical protein SCALA702_26820 [Melioribacteraceae bacterium]